MILRHHRHSTRLPGWNYESGWYFVTICSQNRECIFGEIVNKVMIPNKIGKFVGDIWQSLPEHHPVTLDTFQIMPNHFHGIIALHPVGAHHDAPLYPGPTGAIRESPLQKRSLLSQVIGYFKMNTSKSIHQNDPNIRVWQRNFYDHVIRNESELDKIREYIATNPLRWDKDKDNPKNL